MDPTLFVPAPDLSRSTGLSAGVTGATLTDPSPWRIPCFLAVWAPVVAVPPPVPPSPRMTSCTRRPGTGRGSCGFLRRFRPRYTVGRSCFARDGASQQRSLSPAPAGGTPRRLQLVTAMGTTPSMQASSA